MAEQGQQAPDFNMASDGGGAISLADFKGRNMVLYFYPKDMTPGCTKEAIAFTELAGAFEAANTVVIGVSKDSVARHDKFKAKYGLTVRLGSDEDARVIEDYGVWVEKKLYGRTYMGIERASFLIDGQGVIRQVWRKVRVKGHAEDVLAAAQAI